MKLNLGCGSDLLKDYLNVDIYKPQQSKSNETVENFKFHKSSVEDLSWLEDESVSEIRAKDIIDHIHWKNLKNTFLEWNRILEESGILILSNIPDFEISFKKYFNSRKNKKDWETIQHWVEMFSYKEERFRSKNLLDLSYLEKLLESCGFLVLDSGLINQELYLKCMKGKINNLIDFYLESIEKRIYWIQECYVIWHYLVRDHSKRPQVVSVYNEYIKFFSAVQESSFQTLITKLATLFDKDKRSISFPNLLKKMKKNKVTITINRINYDEFMKKGRRIWNYRCKDVAHIDEGSLVTDFLKEANFTYNEFKEFIDDCGKLIYELFDFLEKDRPNYVEKNSDVQQLIADLSNINKLLS